MQNFSRDEYEEFKARCKAQRDIARANICVHPAMPTCEDYEVFIGPYLLRLYIIGWVRPAAWSGSIGYLAKIGDETIYDKQTGLPIFETAREGLLAPKDWSPEELDVARSLLGDLFGPLIHHRDQQVMENKGPTAMTWIVTVKSANESVAARN